jgi:uncharacterized protein YkwD
MLGHLRVIGRAGKPRVQLTALGAALFLSGLGAGAASARDAVASDLEALRAGLCGEAPSSSRALTHAVELDALAARWATGVVLEESARRAGYDPADVVAVHASSASAAVSSLGAGCVNAQGIQIEAGGSFRYHGQVWAVFVGPRRPGEARLRTPGGVAPVSMSDPVERVLDLVNAVRARGASCGAHQRPPVGAVRLSSTLAQVAYGHALDMAQHGYFEHRDLEGRMPADRVRATGYAERLVGENIAFGPDSPEDVVKGWLDSPGHCENLLDPRFAEMGVAFTTGRAPGSRPGHGRYWVQLLADPRT